jgi:hypothetical protein
LGRQRYTKNRTNLQPPIIFFFAQPPKESLHSRSRASTRLLLYTLWLAAHMLNTCTCPYACMAVARSACAPICVPVASPFGGHQNGGGYDRHHRAGPLFVHYARHTACGSWSCLPPPTGRQKGRVRIFSSAITFRSWVKI